MGELLDAEAVEMALKAALTSHRHWVLVSDGSRGHQFLASLVVGLTAQGYQDFVEYGSCEFLNLPTRHQFPISFVIINKAKLSRRVLNACLRAGGRLAIPAGVQRDIILVTEPGSAPANLDLFLAAVYEGNLAHEDPGLN
jgi:hypothetical protein